MKNFFLLLFLSLLTFVGTSQNQYFKHAQISSSLEQEIISLEMNQYTVASVDNELATIINIVETDPTTTYKMKVLGLDNAGDKNWEAEIPDFIGKQIISTDDGDYFIIGFAIVDDGYQLDIIKFDRTYGYELARYRFPNASAYITSEEDPALILRTLEEEENYIAAIQIEDTYPSVLAFKIDLAGFISWNNIYIGTSKGTGYRLQSLANKHRGGFIIGVDFLFDIAYDGTPVQQLDLNSYLDNQILINGAGEDLLAYNYLNNLYIIRYTNTTIVATYKISSPDLYYINPKSIFYKTSNDAINICFDSKFIDAGYTRFTGFLSIDRSTGTFNSIKQYEAHPDRNWRHFSSMIPQYSNHINGAYYIKGISEYKNTADDKLMQILSVDGLGQVECDNDLSLDIETLSYEFNVESVTAEAFSEYPISVVPTGVNTEQISMIEACDEGGDEAPKKAVPMNGLELTLESDVMIYPNPVSSNGSFDIVIQNIETEGIINIAIYDILGKEVTTKSIYANQDQMVNSLSISKLSTGQYLVKTILPNGKSFTQKLSVK